MTILNKKKILQLILIKNLMQKFLINLKRILKKVKLIKLKFAQNIAMKLKLMLQIFLAGL